MKKLLLNFLLVIISSLAYAYDFEYNGLYYNITSLTTVEVTCCNDYTNPNYIITGDVTIPSAVIHNGNTYIVTRIGSNAFRNCIHLTSITIPNTVTVVRSAFGSCNELTRMTIPSSVDSIEGYFSSCVNLSRINYLGDIDDWCRIKFQYRYSNPLLYAHNLYIHDSLLTVANIPTTVSKVNNYSFVGATCLTSVNLSNSVTSIGEYSFYRCTSLENITCQGNIAPHIGSNAFLSVNDSIPIIIPCGSLLSYYSRWSYFSNFIEPEGYSITMQSNDESMGTEKLLVPPTCSSPQAVINAVPNAGYVFGHWSDGSATNPRYLILTQDTVLTAYFYPEGEVGISELDNDDIRISTQGKAISIMGADGLPISIFDIQGRVLISEKSIGSQQFLMPQVGIYIVKIGDHPARKVILAR